MLKNNKYYIKFYNENGVLTCLETDNPNWRPGEILTPDSKIIEFTDIPEDLDDCQKIFIDN